MTISNGKSTWRPATRENPCPACKHTSWCTVSSDGLACCCRRVSAGAAKTKTDKNGDTVYVHRFGQREPATQWAAPRYSFADGNGQPADAETLDKVYTALLGKMTLSEQHRADLHRRGLSDDAIAERGYRTLGKDRCQAVQAAIAAGLEQHFPRVPGLYVNDKREKPYWSVVGKGGLLIPVRNTDGNIVAIMVRPDKPEGGKKYVWLSSKKHGGASPGSPIHCPVFHGETSRIRVTEGSLKADVATELTTPGRIAHHGGSILTIGMPGVNGAKKVIATAKELKAKIVHVAFDADAVRNRHVAQAGLKLLKALTVAGFTTWRETWPEADGKGIDDVLAAGNSPEVLSGQAAIDAAEATLKAAIAADPPTATDAADGVHYLRDDPKRLAQIFLKRFEIDNHLAFKYWREDFLAWDGAAYRTLNETDVKAQVAYVVQEDFEDENRIKTAIWAENGSEGAPPPCRKSGKSLVANVVQSVTAITHMSANIEPPCWLAQAPDGFNPSSCIAFANAIVSLSKLVAGDADHHIKPTPTFFTRNALNYDYCSMAPRPAAWLKFLDEIWPGDAESIALLQEWFGYVLTPDTSQQKILLLVGPKRSGKGTIARVLTQMIGTSNVVNPTLGSLAGSFGLQPLLGKTAAIVSDARLSGRTDMAVILERLLSISGEDSQTVERKHQTAISGPLPVRFTLLTNELPRINDASGALAGRMMVLRLTRSFYGDEDTGLTAKLLAELPGVLLWAVEGWRRLQERRRMVQPKSAKQLVDDMADLASPIGAFIRDCCVVSQVAEVPKADLYNRWRQWCEQVGKKEPGSNATFGRDLRAALPSIDEYQKGTGRRRIRVYSGIGLQTDDDAAVEPETPETQADTCDQTGFPGFEGREFGRYGN